MKKIIAIFFTIIMTVFCTVSAEETKLLTGSVEMVPKSFYGTWRVVSKIEQTNSPASFQKKGVDIWNLSRKDNVIILCNLFNGAKAEIAISRADLHNVTFTKTGKYGKQTLNDTVELSITGDTFTGYDTLELNTYIDGKIVRTENAKYVLSGEKISGQVE